MKAKKIISTALMATLLETIAITKVHADTTYRYTRYDMAKMIDQNVYKKYRMPSFNANSIKDIPSAVENGKKLDVWDSWPVKNADGTPANIHGYHVVMALVGVAGEPNGLAGKIGIFYQKVSDSDKDVDSWKYAGYLLNSNLEGASDMNDDILKHETGEWSGSSMVQPDGKIRLMYTSFSGDTGFGGYGNNQQTLTTAKVVLNKTSNGLVVDHNAASGRKPIFTGDGSYYETVAQYKGMNVDDHCLRDPQLVIDKGRKYLIFEANTGNAAPSGEDSINNVEYYGSRSFMKKEMVKFNNNKQFMNYAANSNAAIGILELNDDYTVKKALPPLVTFNLVDDETERPSVINYKGRWYVFAVTHGFHINSLDAVGNDVYMLGFSSKKLTGNYKPLNKYGLVAYSEKDIDKRNYSYSYAVNQMPNNPFLLTGYASAIGNAQVGHSTFMPTIQLNVKGKSTSISKKVLKQGQIER